MDHSQRAAQIEAAAYKVIQDKGFAAASMLTIAKAAKASNETLYKWYGDKVGLFASMIKKNASLVEEELMRVRAAGGTGLEVLHPVGKALLTMVTGEKAILLNRAAAGDVSGKLGELLASEGRGRIAPILAELIQEAYGPVEDVGERAETYIFLLLGDLQIRRVISTISVLSEEELTVRSDRALRQFKLIYPLGSNIN